MIRRVQFVIEIQHESKRAEDNLPNRSNFEERDVTAEGSGDTQECAAAEVLKP